MNTSFMYKIDIKNCYQHIYGNIFVNIYRKKIMYKIY